MSLDPLGTDRSVADVLGPVERQLAAYNVQDLDGFAGQYADDVEIYAHPGELVLKGRAAFLERYRARFAQQPAVQAVIPHRQLVGNRVIDHEVLTNFSGAGTVREVAVIYTVEAGVISRVDFVNPD